MARRIEHLVSLDRLFDVFECDPIAGQLIWRRRAETHWRLVAWNKRFAGRVAGVPNTNGHIQVSFKIDGVKYFALAHRIIWAMTFREWIPTELEIDHRNRIRSDNRISNLRISTRTQNCQNKSMQKNNTTGFKGVHWYPRYNKWVAIISIGGKSTNLGYFANIKDAVCAYDSASQKHFKSFSNSNKEMNIA